MDNVEILSKSILKELLTDFNNRRLGSKELTDGYVGVPLASLQKEYERSGAAVDFDLALKELEEKKLVGTGPMALFDNKPGSFAVVLGVFSKREYVFLTEKGYKTSLRWQSAPVPKSSATRVHISGGTFNQSPIGIGSQVSQSITIAGDQVFVELRRAITGGVTDEEERNTLLRATDTMAKAQGTPTFLDRYIEFVAVAANHMTLVAPFLPALTAHLMK